MHRRQLLRLLVAAPATLPLACTKREQAKQGRQPQTRSPTRPAHAPAIADRDMTGRPRAKPRATMGALEAEPGARSPPPKDSKKRSRKRVD